MNKFLYQDKPVDGYFVKFYDLTDLKIRDANKFEKILNCDFLIIDEFGVASADFKDILIYKIYDYRAEANLPTVLITNLKPADLNPDVAISSGRKPILTDALYSRLIKDAMVLYVDGKDLRVKDSN